jgi:hypothetical protein
MMSSNWHFPTRLAGDVATAVELIAERFGLAGPMLRCSYVASEALRTCQC